VGSKTISHLSVWQNVHVNHRLVSIFLPEKDIPLTTAARMQRYALFLTGFTYKIEYRNTKRHGNADILSHLPVKAQDDELDDELDAVHIFYTSQVEVLPVTNKEMQHDTMHGIVLSTIYQFVMYGWQDKSPGPECDPYFNRRFETTTHNECLFWGIRAIIPPRLCNKMLTELHEGHVGTMRKKALARVTFGGHV